MITVKVGTELQEVVKLAYKANKPVLLIGKTGVGKSESLEQCAAQLGIKYVVRDLSLMEGPDLLGLPVIKDLQTKYALPSFLPIEPSCGLLVFEELNRAPRYTRAPCLQLLTARCLNEYKLPKGWLPVAAINPDDDDYSDVDTLDKALEARFMVIRVEPDVKIWLAWAEQNAIHKTVQVLVKSDPKIFVAPGSNPRAWKYVSDVVHAHEDKSVSPNILLAAINGFVGDKLARAFLSLYSNKSMLEVPTPEKLLKSYPAVKSVVVALSKAGDSAKLDSLCHQLLLYLQDPQQEQAAKDNMKARKNLKDLISDLPAEFAKKLRNWTKWLDTK